MNDKNKQKKVHWHDLHVFGVDIHPGIGILLGVIGTTLHGLFYGLFGILGSILIIGSIVALIAKAFRKKNK